MTASTTSQAGLGALVKQLTVPCSRENAFDLFTRRMGEWWPLERFSIGEGHAVTVEFPDAAGGRIVETTDDGRSEVWGTVTAWDPPARVEFTWHPGHPADQATRVEVRFVDEGGSTSVTLTHSGWAGRPDGEQARQSYDGGWDTVLGRYREAAPAAA
jgi:uncharacterized protein YndB with AHSA1/START domain